MTRHSIGVAVTLMLLVEVPTVAWARGRKTSPAAAKGAASATAAPAGTGAASPAADPGGPATPGSPGASVPGAPVVKGSVVVLEYRNGVEQVADLPEQVTQALTRNTSLPVVTAREGRQRYGARLDADVAACAGDVTCLSGVGQRLGVGEVLLAALSQLGDVVVALQRIDVPGRRVSGRVADSLPTGQPVDEARVLGWLQQLYPANTFKRYGQIRVASDVDGAQLYINARARGETPLREPVQVLAPGNYRLLLEKSRYLPFQAAVTVMPDTTVEVSARLVPEVRSAPWYRRWYVWTAIGAGAVAATSVGLAVYYGALRQDPVDMTKVPGLIEIK